MNEMRKDRRAPASLKVKYKSATVDDFIEHFGADVSRGGIFIKTKKPLETGALLKFEFQLQGGAALIQGVGRVAWRRLEDKARTDLPAGMGIKFIKLDDDSRAVIERIETRHGVGSRFDQTEAAEFAAPLSSLPPNPARSGIATPPAPPPPPGARMGEPAQDKPTFRPPPPAISSIPPALADAWPAAVATSSKPERAVSAGPTPKGALGSFQPGAGAATRKNVPSARSAARDTSEFLASAFSVGGAGHDVRSQARVQVERARRDPQSVDLANELFGDLSEPSEQAKPKPPIASDLPALQAASESKVASAHERSLAEKIPSIEDLVNETSSAGSSPGYQRSSAVSVPTVAALGAALSSPPETSAVPLSLALSDRPTRIEPNLETLRPTPPAAKSGAGRWLVGVLIFIGIAVGTFFVVRPPHATTPAAANPSAQEPGAPTTPEAPATPAAAAPTAPTAAAPDNAPTAEATQKPANAEATKPTPIEVSITSEPRGAQVSVDGKAAGAAPVTLSLMTSVAAEISVSSSGYATQTQRVTPETGMKPQHFALTPLPYEIAIVTDPAGATVRVKDLNAVSPAPLALGHVDGMITASVEKEGYQRTSRTVRLEEFHEHNGTMRADLTLSLSALPSAARRKPPVVHTAPTAPQAPPEPLGTTAPPPVVLVKPEPSPTEPAQEAKPVAEAAPKPAEKPEAPVVAKPEPAPSEPAPAPATP